MAFKDYFSAHAADYARHRPGYPDAFFSWLSSLTEAHELAWDCGTGNGQAAHGLARHFERVIATDASADQIANAVPHERITYRVEPAESTSLAGASVDLILVAQALHWIDFDRFYAEARRVLKPGGVIAAASNGITQISPAVDAVIERFYEGVVGPYWPPERRYIDEAYRTIPFPFPELEPPHLYLQAEWAAEDLLAFLNTWSATQRYTAARGVNPLEALRPELLAAWGDADQRRTVKWPLYVRVGQVRPS